MQSLGTWEFFFTNAVTTRLSRERTARRAADPPEVRRCAESFASENATRPDLWEKKVDRLDALYASVLNDPWDSNSAISI
jgi:hypothetical protein